MNTEEMIIGWNGLLPIIANVPNSTKLREKLGIFMDRVSSMGASEETKNPC